MGMGMKRREGRCCGSECGRGRAPGRKGVSQYGAERRCLAEGGVGVGNWGVCQSDSSTEK